MKGCKLNTVAQEPAYFLTELASRLTMEASGTTFYSPGSTRGIQVKVPRTNPPHDLTRVLSEGKKRDESIDTEW